MGKRRFRILDTNIIINWWHKLPRSQRSISAVKAWAKRLTELYDTDLIASPVRVEFLCGALNDEDFRFFEAYLASFTVIDAGKIPRRDWLESERIARRIVKPGRCRKLGDCLLIAISLRLNCEIISADRDIPQRMPPRSSG